MGDNVMICLGDIQHCNPELLQKFISRGDAQWKIDGVYKKKPKPINLKRRAFGDYNQIGQVQEQMENISDG